MGFMLEERKGELHDQACKGPDGSELLVLSKDLGFGRRTRRWKCYKRKRALWRAAPFQMSSPLLID